MPERVVIDNMKTAVVKADRYEPAFQRTMGEYAEHRGFVIDPAVVRHPKASRSSRERCRTFERAFSAVSSGSTWLTSSEKLGVGAWKLRAGVFTGPLTIALSSCSKNSSVFVFGP